MSLNLTDISNACTVTNGTFQGQCIYTYGSDYTIILLTIIAGSLVFVVLYILYKEWSSGKV